MRGRTSLRASGLLGRLLTTYIWKKHSFQVYRQDFKSHQPGRDHPRYDGGRGQIPQLSLSLSIHPDQNLARAEIPEHIYPAVPIASISI